MFFNKKPEHEHWYKTLASHNETIKERVYTHILFQCNCGEWYVETVPGEWIPDEIKLLK